MVCPENSSGGLILLIGRDLIFSSKISGAARNAGRISRGVRSLEDLKQGLAEQVTHVVLDLNVTGIDIPQAIKIVQATNPAPRLLAYYSHVETEVAREARNLGVSEIYARSKFVQMLPELFIPEVEQR